MNLNISGASPDPEGPARPEVAPDAAGNFRVRIPWTFRDLLLFILFAAAAMILLSLLSFAGYAALAPLLGLKASPETIDQNAFLALGAQFFFYVFVFIYIYVLVVYRYHFQFWRGIQWGPLKGRQVGHYVAAGVLMTIAVQFAPTILPDKTNFPLQHLFNSPASAYATAIFAVLIAPFMEELVFRGFLFSVFELRVGAPFAIIATAVLFAAMHAPEYEGAWNHLLLIFFVGLVLSLARGLTHKLAPSVVLHTTYNGCLMIGLFVATSHFHIMQSLAVR